MAHRSRADGDGRYEHEHGARQASEAPSDELARSSSARDTWLCRSTVGEDLSDVSDGEDGGLEEEEEDGGVTSQRGASDEEARAAVDADGAAKAQPGDDVLEDKRWSTPWELRQERKRSAVLEDERWPARGEGSRKHLRSGLGRSHCASEVSDGSGRADASVTECKPAAAPSPLGTTTPPPKLPRIAGWSNVDALRGKLPHPRRLHASGATVSVGRERFAARTKDGSARSVAASSNMKTQAHDGDKYDAERSGKHDLCRHRVNDRIGNRSEAPDDLADRIQRKINSAEWNRKRCNEMDKHNNASGFDTPDNLADRIQHKLDSADWNQPPRAAANTHSDDYVREMSDTEQLKIDCAAGWGCADTREASSDDLADIIQQKIDSAGWSQRRPREEAPRNRIARYMTKLDVFAGKSERKAGRRWWSRRRNNAVNGSVNRQLDCTDTLADKIQQKIDREGWGHVHTGGSRSDVEQIGVEDDLADRIQQKIGREGWGHQAGNRIDKQPQEMSADTDTTYLKPTRQLKPLEQKLRSLDLCAPDVTVGKHQEPLLFAEKAASDHLPQQLDVKLRHMDNLSSPSHLKIVVDNDDEWATKCNFGDNDDSNNGCDHGQSETPLSRGSLPLSSKFRVSESLTHLIVFASTATLHCGVFTFSAPLRLALSLEAYPFGVVLLVCWAIEGLARCVGGVLGDLVVDRVALLRRAALLWILAVLLFVVDTVAVRMVASSTMSSLSATLANVILGVAFLFGGGAHGVMLPNMVALGAQAALHRHRTQPQSLFSVSTPKSPSPRESMSMTRIYSEVSEEGEEQAGNPSDPANQQLAVEGQAARPSPAVDHARLSVNRYYSASFAASTAGSSFAQVFFFVFAEELSLPSSPSSPVSSSLSSLSTSSSARGIVFLSVTGAILLASLGTFMYQTRGYCPSSLGERSQWLCQRICRTKAFDAAGGKSDDPARQPSAMRWLKHTHGTSLIIVGYALGACTVLLFAGCICSVVILAVFPQSALAVRLSPFLAVMVTWLVGMSMASRMLKAVTTRKRSSEDTSEEEGTETEQIDELPEPDEHQRDVRVQFTLTLLALGGALACAMFVRGQLYSTIATQLCQTNGELPSALVGSASISLRPEVAGGAVGLSSVLLLVVLMQLDYIRQACASRSELRPRRSRWSWLQLASTAPATRMAVAAALSLTGLFLASVVELYRRHAPLLPAGPFHGSTRQCFKPTSDLNLLWSIPALVVLGVADALFRVSLHEQVHLALLQCHDAGLCDRWAGRVLGALALAESLGNAAALALVVALASWLLGPTPSDLTLVFLLLTTALALTFVMLKGIGKRVARVAAVTLKRTSTARAAARETRVITVVTPPPAPAPGSYEFTDEEIRKLMTATGG